jgi:hypothetical protein
VTRLSSPGSPKQATEVESDCAGRGVSLTVLRIGRGDSPACSPSTSSPRRAPDPVGVHTVADGRGDQRIVTGFDLHLDPSPLRLDNAARAEAFGCCDLD